MSNGKGPAKSLLDDKKVHKDLREAAEIAQGGRRPAPRPQKKRKASASARRLLVAIVGAALVLILSEDARKAVLDKLFGAEEEFEYTSTTTASAPSGTAAPTTNAS